MAFGVLTTGFSRPQYTDILREIETQILADVDAALDLSPELPLGQIIGILAAREAALWELLETAYGANDRNKASYFLLDSLGTLTGTTRKAASYSTVTLPCKFSGVATLTSGTTKANVTGIATDTWTPVDDYTSSGAGTFDVVFRATTRGPRAANANTIIVINTPVSGWTTVGKDSGGTPDHDAASPGIDEETDTAYRARQVLELAQAGSSTTTAIRAALLEIDGVIEAKVFENTTNVTDGDGLPAHTLQAVIWDDDAASNTVIAQALWDNKGGGIGYFGSVSADAVDAEGTTRTMDFDRVTQKPVYIDITVVQDPDLPAIVTADVKQAIKDKSDTYLRVGTDVIALALRASALNVAGVLDASVFELGFSAAPAGTANLTVGSREIATVALANITVTVA
jgi:hypothetical protein